MKMDFFCRNGSSLVALRLHESFRIADLQLAGLRRQSIGRDDQVATEGRRCKPGKSGAAIARRRRRPQCNVSSVTRTKDLKYSRVN